MLRLMQLIRVGGYVTVAGMIVLLAINVVMRYVLSSPITWAEEAGQLMLLWLTFLGASAAAEQKSHLRMSLLDKYLYGVAARIYHTSMSLISVVVLGVIAYVGVILTQGNLDRTANYLPLSFAWFYAPVAVGGALYAVFELRNAILAAQGRAVLPDSGISEIVQAEREDDR